MSTMIVSFSNTTEDKIFETAVRKGCDCVNKTDCTKEDLEKAARKLAEATGGSSDGTTVRIPYARRCEYLEKILDAVKRDLLDILYAGYRNLTPSILSMIKMEIESTFERLYYLETNYYCDQLGYVNLFELLANYYPDSEDLVLEVKELFNARF